VSEPPTPPAGRSRDDLPPLADDGLPTLPTGEPVLARWFVVAMLLLVPAAIGVTIWAALSIPDGDIEAAERRPPGDGQVTYDRGDAMLGETLDGEAGPGCAGNVELLGDEGGRAAARVAMRAVCEALRTPGLDEARDGLRAMAGGQLQFAIFERSGVESSTRVEDGTPTIELNAKFQFEDAARAAPVVIHELTLLGGEFPGEPVGAVAAVRATEAQLAACDALDLLDEDDPPRGCLDAAELLEQDDPVGELLAAGLRDDR
jgi:hypothetical protein